LVGVWVLVGVAVFVAVAVAVRVGVDVEAVQLMVSVWLLARKKRLTGSNPGRLKKLTSAPPPPMSVSVPELKQVNATFANGPT